MFAFSRYATMPLKTSPRKHKGVNIANETMACTFFPARLAGGWQVLAKTAGHPWGRFFGGVYVSIFIGIPLADDAYSARTRATAWRAC